jgi:predicted DNA-binding transcriptional regulator AlpA
MEALLTVELLSARLHKSVTSIRSDVTRNPRSLPPICRLPGTKRLLWRESDVDKWLADYVVVSAPGLPVSSPASTGATKRGRPTKREQMGKNQRRTQA